MTGITAAALALFVALALLGALLDLRSRKIPNLLNVTMALAGLASVWFLAGGGSALSALGHLTVALILGMAAFAFKMWGGGDAKFYAATAAWFELSDFPALIIAISLAGLLLLLGWMALARIRKHERAERRKAQLPYGVAIAAGGIVTMATSAIGGSTL